MIKTKLKLFYSLLIFIVPVLGLWMFAGAPSATGVTANQNAFVEQNGLVVFEVETANPWSDWSLLPNPNDALEPFEPGFTGNGYFIWQKNNFDGNTFSNQGSGTINYKVKFNTAGQYRLQYRSLGYGGNTTKFNDIWLRSEDASITTVRTNNPTLQTTIPQNTWFKSYQNRPASEGWTWVSHTIDETPHNIFVNIPGPGYYDFQIAGRAAQFKVDRFVIYNPTLVTEQDATNIENPQSPIEGVVPPTATPTIVAPPTATALPTQIGENPGDAVMRINAGGPSISFGNEFWEADKYVTTIGGQQLSYLPTSITGSDRDLLYNYERSTGGPANTSSFSYALPVNPTKVYTVNLHFAEIWFTGLPGRGPDGAGQRVFNVNIEGQPVLVNFDPFVDAGGAATAIIKTFENIDPNGSTLDIQFLPGSADRPQLAAIELFLNAEVPPTETPIPTETPVPPTEVPTETPVPPTEVPTETPVPPTEVPPTEVPPTETPVTPTETPVTPTETPITPTETPVTPTPEPTPDDRVPGNLILNADFENAGLDGRAASAWTNPATMAAPGNRRRCDRPDKKLSFSGECLYQFKGTVGERSVLMQALDSSLITETGSLTLTGYAWARNLSANGFRIQVRIRYNDGTVRDRINVDLPPGSYDYTRFVSTINVSSLDIRDMRVKMRMRANATGRVRVDALWMEPTGVNSAPLPIPQP